jgi:serine protease
MLLPVRVLGKCGGYDSDIQAAMLWSAGLSSDPVVNPHPAQVINLSLGSTGSCGPDYQSIMSQLVAARVTVVVAAGNETGLAVNTPANCPGVIAVAGLRHAGTKVGYSSIGPEVAIAAPAGNCVNTASGSPCLYSLLTTNNAGTNSPGANGYSDSYTITVGTSFAAPLVAGTAALMLSVDPTLTSAQVKTALQATARTFPTNGGTDAAVQACKAPSNTEQLECYCTTKTCGVGMMDAGAAVARVQAPLVLPTAVIALATAAAAVGDSVTLNGSASTAAAGRTIAGFQWAIASGAGLASFTGATDGSSVTLATTAAGTVVISLTVTDSAGGTRTATQSINIAAAPVASIAPANVNVTVGATVALNGSGSSAATGRSIVAYQWTLISGSAIAAFSGATNSSSATLVTSAAGTVVVSLTVTDSAGAVRSATQAINVAAAPTAAIALSAAIPTAGSAVSLSGAASSAAAGRTIIGYQWAIVSGASLASFTGASNAATALLATRAAGTVVVSLTVTDSAGGVRTIAQSIDVVAAPTAAITVPATPSVAGASVTLDASASSAGAGRSIAVYQWAITSGAGLASFSGPTTGKIATLATTSVGTVVVNLTVTDSVGESSSASQSIAVVAASVVVTPPASGGGALGLGWLIGLAAAVGLLARRRS